MLLQAIVAIAWLVWLFSGTAGLKESFTVGALLIVGFAVKQFLDFHWKPTTEEKRPRRQDYDSQPFFSSYRHRRGALPSPNWGFTPYGTNQSTPGPGRLGRR